jgi:hypothetical protein
LVVEFVGLVWGRAGGEMGSLGVNGVGGIVRWEERKGVGVIVKVGMFSSVGRLLLLLGDGVVETMLRETKTGSVFDVYAVCKSLI